MMRTGIIEIDPKELRLLEQNARYMKHEGFARLTANILGAAGMSEANLKFQTLNMVFLPDELGEAKKIIGQAVEQAKDADETWLARMSEYGRWLDGQEAAAAAHGVKNVATAVDIVLRVFERNMAQLSEAWENTDDNKRWVPIESVIGRNKIPAGSAKVIRKAPDRMAGKGDMAARNLWQGLEYLCADYLSGE